MIRRRGGILCIGVCKNDRALGWSCPFDARSLLRTFFVAHRVLSKRSALKNGGGGSRTRVPRAFTRGIYMLSLEFVVVAESSPDRLFSFQTLESTADN